MAPTPGQDLVSLQRRTLRVLLSGQVLGSAGLGSSVTVGGLIVKDLLGGDSFAGAASAAATVGAALASIPLSNLMRRHGRRPPSGTLENYSISKDGVITGIFSNGLTRSLGQLGMAKFSNPEGMNRDGGNLFLQSNNSGNPLVGTANDSGMGTVNAGYLEQANVDMSGEMTDLIITQRGFQANTKIVTTVDEMLQELINIKR